ncbi:hypothetical protein [Rhizobium leguminosarum]|uniref:Ubiquitin-like domain-containing protein n=1 Tax=Rhizobium leguminosarum TaxID=384 RepID=A0A2K9ZG12_RHILE|nr:hypothetical protein [Rhizobium leguminosarum]AUW47159.1 hypothetical protein CUJ84_pRLN3000017 [Rhizobium leguminosarum]
MNKITLFVQFEASPNIELIELSDTATFAELILAATERGLPDDVQRDALIFIEEKDEALETDLSLTKQGVKHKDRVTIHRCRRVEVSVAFNARLEQRKFNPAATVGRVKRWFVDEIGMTPVDASEHVLQITGTNRRPDHDVPIGTVVTKGTCSVEFTLVPRKRVEG